MYFYFFRSFRFHLWFLDRKLWNKIWDNGKNFDALLWILFFNYSDCSQNQMKKKTNRLYKNENIIFLKTIFVFFFKICIISLTHWYFWTDCLIFVVFIVFCWLYLQCLDVPFPYSDKVFAHNYKGQPSGNPIFHWDRLEYVWPKCCF